MLENMFDDEGRPTPEFLRELLEYNPETGRLFWRERGAHIYAEKNQAAEQVCKSWNTRFAGKAAFSTARDDGYLVGTLFAKKYRAHRIIYALHYGEWPMFIDHINGDRSDNRIGNLRSVTLEQNSRNCKRSALNTSGVCGVSWCKMQNTWRAYIRVNGKRKHLGRFVKIEDAIAARKAANRKYNYHKNHGRD
jgi:hypothetical protein